MRKIIILYLIINILIPQNIWKNKGEIFTDKKNFKNGDIIHISIKNDLVINYKASLSQSKAITGDENRPASTYLDFLPEINYNSSASKNDNADLAFANNMEGTITGTITGVTSDDKNSIYSFRALHLIRINNKIESVTMNGSFDSHDIFNNNYLDSKSIANLNISYAGYNANKTEKFSKNDFIFPQTSKSGKTNSIDLTEEIKKELFIEYFNTILNLLF